MGALSKSLFLRQFKALFVKNLITFRRQWIVNIFRALLFPIGVAILLAYSPSFFGNSSAGGIGQETTLQRLDQTYDGSRPFVWADNTGGTGFIKATDIMDRVTANFTKKQLRNFRKLDSTDNVTDTCILNFSGASNCFAALTIDGIPTNATADTRGINYTIWTDSKFFAINVHSNDNEYDRQILPLQWAVDRAIIELSTGRTPPYPSYLLYTPVFPGEAQALLDSKRLLFLSLAGTFTGLPFFITFVSAAYHLAGGVAGERASLLTSHLQAMGALDSARILSWHTSLSILYLPSWIVSAVVWHSKLFRKTSLGLVIGIHLLEGLALISWSLFACVPFKKSPQFAAVTVSVACLVLAVIPLDLAFLPEATAAVLSFFFPATFFVFALKAICGYEQSPDFQLDIAVPDPVYGITLQSLIIAAALGIVVWPIAAIYFERAVHKILNPSNATSLFQKSLPFTPRDPSIAISIQNIRKTFNNSSFRQKSKEVVAIADVSLDIPTYGITVLLGPNGAGKSTLLSVISGQTSATSGNLAFEGTNQRPPLGTLGIVPQKNVLFTQLTCLENLRLWNAIKAPAGDLTASELENLIRDCNLETKMHEFAGTLSGGQKRKLQLAIGLVGGSKVVLVDECTSGVDPLSRRSLWKTLSTYRSDRTIVLTTHFLDEADFLADRIAVIDAPGKLVAYDTPVALKSTKGEGYSVSVKFGPIDNSSALHHDIERLVPGASYTHIQDSIYSYHLKTQDTGIVAQVARLVQNSTASLDIVSYELHGTTVEDIFLDLLAKEELGHIDMDEEKDSQVEKDAKDSLSGLILAQGHPRSPWAQATTIFHKRLLIARRGWIIPLLTVFIGIAGAWWPIRFVTDKVTSCGHIPFDNFTIPTYPPILFDVLAAPPSAVDLINNTLPDLWQRVSDIAFDPSVIQFLTPLPSKADLVNNLTTSSLVGQFSMGGFSADLPKDDLFVAANALNFDIGFIQTLSNLYWPYAANLTGVGHPERRRLVSHISILPTLASESLFTLEWVSVFGAVMVIYPAFFAIYIAKERHGHVQAMHLSNGLTNPLGLWLGHLMFDSMFTVVISTVIAIVYSTVRDKFQGIGLLWLIMCLYGWAGTLVSYISATMIKSPLGAFALAVFAQAIVFIAYLVGYVLTLYFALAPDVPHVMNTIHFTLSLIAPINSLARAAFASVNQFALLCEGEKIASGSELVTITRFGGPILYLVVWIIVLLLVLAQIDGKFIRFAWPRPLTKRSLLSGSVANESNKPLNPDVLEEAQYANSPTTTDPLRVLGISKRFGRNRAVDNVSFTIPHSSVFVLLGPNGAGKTTTLDMIGGHLEPDSGDVKVEDKSIYHDLRKARAYFGVCPQFTAIDAHLSVREHLHVYARLRGLSGEELKQNIDALLSATSLDIYANRLASKLSGGNQRKLALAIALIGNPPVVLVDEFSTGIDARMKRELWAVLKQVTKDKAVLLTTHSMEEASYLATKVGIMSQRMLAIGTPEELESRSESYEVHFSCQSPEDLLRVRAVMARLPGARMSDDVATRFEVPVGPSSTPTSSSSSTSPAGAGEKDVVETHREPVLSVASILEVLAQEEGSFPEFTVGKSSLETAFIKIINENHAAGVGADAGPGLEDGQARKRFLGLA